MAQGDGRRRGQGPPRLTQPPAHAQHIGVTGREEGVDRPSPDATTPKVAGGTGRRPPPQPLEDSDTSEHALTMTVYWETHAKALVKYR